jgi:choline monooxygenase
VASYVGAGEPVLVVRGEDGELRAFSNVCRHHAARVAEGCGTASQFVCPYHAWTYNLKGGLVKFSKMRGIKDFDASKVHLPRLEVEQWGPLVFVRSRVKEETDSKTDPDDAVSVSEMLAPVSKELDAMDSG